MRRIIKREDGGISVINPAPKSRREDETEVDWLAIVFAKATPAGAEFIDVPASGVPSDRTFREAWIYDGAIKVHMGKAKEIHKNRWREARKPLLENLDAEFMRALESDDKAKMAEIKAKKQALRDITKTDLSAVATPEALKQIWPEILK